MISSYLRVHKEGITISEFLSKNQKTKKQNIHSFLYKHLRSAETHKVAFDFKIYNFYLPSKIVYRIFETNSSFQLK